MLNVKMRPHVFLLDFITPVGKSGRGLPQSKTLSYRRGRREVRQVLDCASPLALWLRARDGRRGKLCLDFITPVGKSGRGLPQSKTLRARRGRREVRQVLDCASPLALWLRVWSGRRRKLALDFITPVGKSSRGLPQSKTLRDRRGCWEV